MEGNCLQHKKTQLIRSLYLVFGIDQMQKRTHSSQCHWHSGEVFGKYELDNNITNIEDRLWGERVIEDGYKIYYSSASVFHWHGIHHNQDIGRADKIHMVENMKFVKTCTI